MAKRVPFWAKVAIAATVMTMVAGGAIGAGVYFGLKGLYFDFNYQTKSFFQIDNVYAENCLEIFRKYLTYNCFHLH